METFTPESITEKITRAVEAEGDIYGVSYKSWHLQGGDSRTFKVQVRNKANGELVLDILFHDGMGLTRFSMSVEFPYDEATDTFATESLELSKKVINALGVPVTDVYITDLENNMWKKYDPSGANNVKKSYGNYYVTIEPNMGNFTWVIINLIM